MRAIVLPTADEKKMTRPSRGEIFGNLWSTKNIDLERNKGKIRLAQRFERILDSGDDSDFECPVAMIRTNADQTDRWWVLAQADATSVSDGLLFKSTDASSVILAASWAQDAIANSPTDCVDNMVIFGQASSYDRLIVARDTDLAMMNNGSWTASWWVTTLGQSALSATNPHHIHQFLNLLIVPDGNVVHTVDDALVVSASRLVFPKEYQVIWVENDGYRVYFGTRHIRNGDGLIFPWDGTSDKYDEPYPTYANQTFAGKPKNGIMHTINSNGQVLAFNGAAFEEVAHTPMRLNRNEWIITYNSRNTVVHQNGMEVVDGNINILMNNGIGGPGSTLENCLAGIWELSPDAGLYLKHTLGQYDGVTNNEWGAGGLRVSGCLKEVRTGSIKMLFAGAVVYSDNASTQVKALLGSMGGGSNRGYFTTSQIQAPEFMAFWTRLQMAFKKNIDSGDTILAKYMVEDNVNMLGQNSTHLADITWSSTTVFTSTASIFGSVSVGDEIEVTVGKGAGALAHVSAISEAGGTYTVTLDEAIPNVSGTARVRPQVWKKLGSITSQTAVKKLFTVVKRSKWIKLKVELRGSHNSPEIEQLFLEFEGSAR